jgi:hypothetical protein
LEAKASIRQKRAQAKGISVSTAFQDIISPKITPHAKKLLRIKISVKNTNGLINHRLIVRDDTASPSFYKMKRRFPAGRMQRLDKKIPILIELIMQRWRGNVKIKKGRITSVDCVS